MIVTLPWPHPHLSPNARVHRMAVARLRKRARMDAHWECRIAGIRRMDVERLDVCVTFHPPDNRHRDDDNMVASAKSALDGVSDAVGVDDSRWKLSHRRGAPVKGGEMVVELVVPS